jgi:hypothetical protein
MTELTEQRIAEFKALRAAITPPPWYAEYHDGPDIDDLVAFFRKAAEYSTRTRLELVMTGQPNEDGICPEGTVTVAMTGNGPTSEANAYFVARAPEMFDVLLAEVERLRGENERYRAALTLAAERFNRCADQYEHEGKHTLADILREWAREAGKE